MLLDRWSTQIGILHRMLRDRGYTNIQPIGTGSDPVLLYTCRTSSSSGDVMHAYVTNELRIGVKTVRKLREDCRKAEVSHLLLLCEDGVTPFASKEVEQLNKHQLDLEIFRRKELAFCVVDHMLVPPHVALAAEEKQELLRRLGGVEEPEQTLELLPRLKKTDPVAKYYHYELGTVVGIDRRIGCLEMETYYRVVVPG